MLDGTENELLTIPKKHGQVYRMKAPPFTAENARDMALRAHASRKARTERVKAELLASRKSAKPDDDEARRQRVQKQIDILLTDMESVRSVETRMKIGAAIERLWKLVQPTAGVMKPASRRAANRPAAEPISDQTPQAQP